VALSYPTTEWTDLSIIPFGRIGQRVSTHNESPSFHKAIFTHRGFGCKAHSLNAFGCWRETLSFRNVLIRGSRRPSFPASVAQASRPPSPKCR
jgi:hypothetical protein